MRDFARAFMLGNDECAVIVVSTIGANVTRCEELDEPPLQCERKFAQARNADRPRKKLSCARLIDRQNRRCRFEPAVTAFGEARRIGTLIGERRFLSEPADVERPQIRVEMARMHVQKARAGAAPKIFVAAAHSKVDIHRRDVDRKNAERMIDVEQQFSAAGVRCRNDLADVAKSLARVEDDFGNDDEVGRPGNRSDNVPRIEPAVVTRLGKGQCDTTPPRVFAQNHVKRIEFAARCHDARHIIVGV